MKIKEKLKKWFEKNNISEEEIDKNINVLKEAFLAGYNSAIEDREKLFNKL